MAHTLSILHISDLHRSTDAQTSNIAIVASLVADRDKYSQTEQPCIQAPDIVIVSGDVIQGSNDPTNSEALIRQQYAEAQDLLSEIANQFLDGDKDRVVIVPGNHDVDWKMSVESMSIIDSGKIFDGSDNVKSEFLHGAINHLSRIRWNWKKLSFLEISDYDKYKQRMAAFSKFYHEFYEGKRRFSLEENEQFEIFDFPQFNTTIVGYNSCYCNDHLQFTGNIHPECIANSMMQIRGLRDQGRLVLGVWHHNTRGLPYEVNYMDGAQLKNFINSGISLGFHGHQHKTEIISEYSDALSQKKIIVFSAGTLCGGPKELPVGNNRQYNIVEITWEDDKPTLDVTLHTREKSDTSTFDNPIWRPGRIDSNLVSHYTVQIVRPEPPAITSHLIEIEKLMKESRWEEAVEDLMKLDVGDPFVRRFLLECFLDHPDPEKALEVFHTPRSNEELILALESASETKQREIFWKLVEIGNKICPGDSTVKILIEKGRAILG